MRECLSCFNFYIYIHFRMARTATHVKVGRRTLELSNLTKVLFPEDHLVKAELIEYYLKIAPTLLTHIKGRPLSLVRYPDGIHGGRFFQKNRPEWAPPWVAHVALGDEEPVDYILATEEATLVWLANLACIELHQMHSRQPHLDSPDYMVFDLDPPEGFEFGRLTEIAVAFHEHVQRFGYHAFVKTSGRKGLHIVVPVEPKWDFHTVFEAAREVAQPFAEQHKDTTLHIRKEARKGRVLVDIYRNRQFQSIVSPYSVRGVAGAPVSMPVRWESLPEVEDPGVFNLRIAVDHLLSEGDAWEGMAAYAVALHTQRRQRETTRPRPKPSDKYKTPEALQAYASKRSFERTPEPGPRVVPGEGNAFVIHRHHASRLHYDLRLERDGTLKSWAVPKGLPPRPGIKRLAVAVEDHPVEYLNFEGEIPKGEYGGGMMWIYALGKYEITKDKRDGFYFRLQSRELTGEYRMHRTRENEWLLERVDTPQIDWLRDRIDPMLAESREAPPTEGDYLFELKWDGIRALIALDEGGVTIRGRSHRDLTPLFPELLIPDAAFRATSALFDAEIVCLDGQGKPDFQRVVSRLHHRTERSIERARQKHPAYGYVFDCLYLDGRAIVHEPLERRRAWMADAIRKNTPYRVSEAVTEGRAFFEAARANGLEGIMAKERNSPYLPGKRAAHWLKIKTRHTAECVIIGYTEGKGDRKSLFGALHLATVNGTGALNYRGKVGTGFDEKRQKEILAALQELEKIDRPVAEKPADDARTVWVEPRLVCDIQYASETANGTFREPVFLRLRPDLYFRQD